MELRKLRSEDACFMLEWMHDEDITKDLRRDFASKTLDDVLAFIEYANTTNDEVHMAIVDDNDVYMGTASLKSINNERQDAELAIVIRRAAMGKGYSRFAMREIMRIAFEQHNIENVYWCVSKANTRADKFYSKCGFCAAENLDDSIYLKYESVPDLNWYNVNKKEFESLGYGYRDNVLGCKIINIKTVPTKDEGNLSFFEENRSFPYDIKRIYYISGVPEGVERGHHAHKELKQLLFCPYGEIVVTLDNGKERESILLDNPSIGLIIDRPLWREMIWLKKNSVLCVAASDYYTEQDYIRNYDDFLEYMNKQTC